MYMTVTVTWYMLMIILLFPPSAMPSSHGPVNIRTVPVVWRGMIHVLQNPGDNPLEEAEAWFQKARRSPLAGCLCWEELLQSLGRLEPVLEAADTVLTL